MAVVTVSSDFGAQGNKVCHCFHCFPIYLPWSDGTGCHDLSFLNVWVLSQLFHSPLSPSSRSSLVPLSFLPCRGTWGWINSAKPPERELLARERHRLMPSTVTIGSKCHLSAAVLESFLPKTSQWPENIGGPQTLSISLVTPWIAARQTSLFITNSWSLPKLMFIESVMPSNHLILCRHRYLKKKKNFSK